MTLTRTPIAAFAFMAALSQSPAHSQSDPCLDRETITTAFQLPSTANMDVAIGTVDCPDDAVLITAGAWKLSCTGGIPPYKTLMASSPSGNGWMGVARGAREETGSLAVNPVVSAVCAVLPD